MVNSMERVNFLSHILELLPTVFWLPHGKTEQGIVLLFGKKNGKNYLFAFDPLKETVELQWEIPSYVFGNLSNSF